MVFSFFSIMMSGDLRKSMVVGIRGVASTISAAVWRLPLEMM